MEIFFGVVALLFLVFPIIAFFISLGARDKVRTLERTVRDIGCELKEAQAKLMALTARDKTVRDLGHEIKEVQAQLTALTALTALPQRSAPAAPVPEQASAPEAQAASPAQEPMEPMTAAIPPPLAPVPAMPAALSDATADAASTAIPAIAAETPAPIIEAPAPPSAATSQPAPASAQADHAAAPVRPPKPPAAPVRQPPKPTPAWVSHVKNWLFGGNLVAKMGLLILFIGVGFLLKYAASRITVPIELRLAGITLADIALLIWGWRIRLQRPGIGLPVQGASLAILMMITFAAFRLYDLIPSGMAFALLFLLTGFTCVLAVLQNALWLAIFGITGGFAAPIMTSTGAGSHIALFSYYALLNGGIFGIAWHRSWRSLNLLGFVFTFLIGSAWGVMKYTPENYLSSQLFLLLFFAFYVAIALLYATRQAPRLKHYVDATLIFGTPIVAFGLQCGLVRQWQFGVALSSLALGLLYASLGVLSWRRHGMALKMLTEAFIALGVVFGTLAIPFALDGRWTSAAWALEGAGIVWVGLRQRQRATWLFGLLVQAGAWLSFLLSLAGIETGMARQSNLWLGFLLLAATTFLLAGNFRSHAARNADQGGDGADAANNAAFGRFATVFLAFAAIWLVAGAWTEIFMRTSGATQATLVVLSALFTATGLGYIAKKMLWLIAQTFAIALQVITGVILLILTMLNLHWPLRQASADLLDGPFLAALLIGAASLFSALVFQRQESAAPATPGKLARALLWWSGFWWFGQVLYAFAGWALTHYLIHGGRSDYDNLFWCAYGIGLALTGPLFAKAAPALRWPDLRWFCAPNWIALTAFSLAMLESLYPGNAMPASDRWLAFIALWLAAEWLMYFWQNAGWPSKPMALKCLHVVRGGAPWLMIWPTAGYFIARWLGEDDEARQKLLEQAGWFTSGSWARYIPAWIMMALIAWLIRRVRANGWPVKPLAPWYQSLVVPLASGCSIALAAVWNLTQNGSMAPLPYLPLLNPLDLSTCFAVLLGLAAYRLCATPLPGAAPAPSLTNSLANSARLPFVAGLAAYAWFNLMLLRTAAHVLEINYQFEPLFSSTIVQTMLSLVWTVSAFILMRHATNAKRPGQWVLGAVLLGVVVAKLFLIDQSNSGSVERIVAFVGVGILMVIIGYLAPYPAKPKTEQTPGTIDQ